MTVMTKIKKHPDGREYIVGTFSVPQPRGLYVAIDIAKYYHKAVIFNFQKEVLEGPFTFDIYEEGFKLLLEKIEKAKLKEKTNYVVVGLEATGHYHENILRCLRKRFKVMVINPYATFKTRRLDIDYVKTDEIDLKAIGETLLLGKGIVEAKETPSIYSKLKALTRFRRTKIKARAILKTQILRDLDNIWPGIQNRWRKSQGLFTDLWSGKIAQGILKFCPSPYKAIELGIGGLVRLFKQHKISGLSYGWATKIVNHATRILKPPRDILKIHLQVLKTNLKLLEDLNQVIDKLEKEIEKLVPKTQGGRLLSIKGIGAVSVGEFMAEIGDTHNYSSASEWIKLAGNNPSRNQSGLREGSDNSITKVGNKFLRATIFTIARNISRHEPFFIDYKKRFLAKGKHLKVAYGAVGTKFLRVAFGMLKNNTNFDSKYEEKKGSLHLTQNN